MPRLPPQKFWSLSAVRPREQTVSAMVSDKHTRPLSDVFKEAIQNCNIEVPQNSRISHYLKVIDDSNSDLRTKIMAHQELMQLLLSLNTISNISEWGNTLDSALRYESAIPNPTSNQTKGRDSLFELYVAARMKNIGIDVIQGEPDIICKKQGFRFSISAKRIKSKNKILARVKEARNQIEKSRIPGVIALDLSPLQDGYHGCITGISALDFSRKGFDFLDEYFESLLPDIQKICQRKHVFGVIAFAMFGAQEENGHTILLSQVHSGHRLCMPGSIKSNNFWEIVDLLGRVPTTYI